MEEPRFDGCLLLLARAEEALKERKAAVSLLHVAMERGFTHSGVALRSAEGLWWVIEVGEVAYCGNDTIIEVVPTKGADGAGTALEGSTAAVPSC